MKNKLTPVLLLLFAFGAVGWTGHGQQKMGPLSKAEILTLLKQTPERRSSQGDLAEEIAERGLSFKPDERTIEEFRQAGAKAFLLEAIRRAGGIASQPQTQTPASASSPASLKPDGQAPLPTSPPDVDRPVGDLSPEEREAALARLPLLEQARWHALEYLEELPNFTVTQIVTRYERTPETRDWKLLDKLEIELTYRVKEGEKFKLLKVNGSPARTTYEKIDGSTSTGEFGLMLGALFSPSSHAEFKQLKNEVYSGHPTVVFDFRVKKVDSTSYIVDKTSGKSLIAGYTGTVWIDTESKKVLRVELSHENIPASFPISLAENAVEYDWVTIAGQRHLLPVRAEVLMGRESQRYYSRNVIELRNYHKFETDVQIGPIKDPPQ